MIRTQKSEPRTRITRSQHAIRRDSPMKRVSVYIFWPLFILSAPAIGAAADPVAPAATAEASVHFNRGVELYREGNLDAALAEFVRANEISPNYRLSYNMAQVQIERHDYVRAVALLESYLEQGGAEIAAARRAEVEQEAARLRERIAVLWITADVEAASVWVNDERIAGLPLQKPVMLNAGVARLRVEAEGRKPYIAELSVAGGDRPRLELSLEVLPTNAPTLTPAIAPNDAEPGAGWSPLRATGFASELLGVACLGVGVGFGVSVLNHADTANALCDGNRCTSQRGVEAAKTAATQATLATVGVASGAALIVTGAIFWFAGARDSSASGERAAPDVSVRPVASSSELALALSGRW
jgi:hypothetical protein